MMDCADVDELLPGLALGATSPAEAREIEQHLARCEHHAELEQLRNLTGVLPMSVPPVPPPGELRHQLMARVYRDLEPRLLGRPWWQRTWSSVAAAVLAVITLGLGLRNWAVSSQLAAAPVSWQLNPSAAGVQASGTLVYVPSQTTATLTMRDVPPLPADSVYEVWLIKGGKPEAAGVFRPDPDGSASAIVKGTPSNFDTVAITQEPGPQGSAAPTTQPFVAGPIR